jgi:hypothetical protein
LKKVIGLVIVSLLLTGCASDPLAEQFRAGDNKNYIAGDGTVTEFGIDQRASVQPWSGITESGAQLSSDSLDVRHVALKLLTLQR